MEVVMSYYERISCWIAIQVCTGYLPNGRERHRSFSMRGIRPDASLIAIANVIRALAPLLAYPITEVRRILKREIFFVKEQDLPDEEPALPAPLQKSILIRAFDTVDRNDTGIMLPEHGINELNELRKKIKENGVEVPILVRATGAGSYEVLDGWRRLQICSGSISTTTQSLTPGCPPSKGL